MASSSSVSPVPPVVNTVTPLGGEEVMIIPPPSTTATSSSSRQHQCQPVHWHTSMTRTIAHYDICEQIGEGTYGQVYRGQCKDTGRAVALKKMRIHHGGYWGMPLQLVREIKILKKLHHPNLLELIEVVTSKGVEHLDPNDPPLPKHDVTGAAAAAAAKSNRESEKIMDAREGYKGNLFLVLEYGTHDLTGLLDINYPFTAVQIKCIMQQLLSALKFMHHNKYVHRDIKSSNILLDEHFHVKLADFGLARCLEPPILDQLQPQPTTDLRSSSLKYTASDLTNKVITLWYRPPEILLGATEYGPGVDVWSAGCILAELMLGKPLFTGKTEMDQWQAILDLLGTPSDEAWQYLSKGLKKTRGSASTSTGNSHSLALGKPRASRLQDKYSHKFPAAALNLVEKLLEWDPRKRLTAGNALEHRYFWTSPVPPSDPAELGTLFRTTGIHFHEFQTKKKRKQAKALAEEAKQNAILAGKSSQQAQAAFDEAYSRFIQEVATTGFVQKEPTALSAVEAADPKRSMSRDRRSLEEDRPPSTPPLPREDKRTDRRKDDGSVHSDEDRRRAESRRHRRRHDDDVSEDEEQRRKRRRREEESSRSRRRESLRHTEERRRDGERSLSRSSRVRSPPREDAIPIEEEEKSSKRRSSEHSASKHRHHRSNKERKRSRKDRQHRRDRYPEEADRLPVPPESDRLPPSEREVERSRDRDVVPPRERPGRELDRPPERRDVEIPPPGREIERDRRRDLDLPSRDLARDRTIVDRPAERELERGREVDRPPLEPERDRERILEMPPDRARDRSRDVERPPERELERARDAERPPDRERERSRDLDRIPDRERERGREIDRVPDRERERGRDVDRIPDRERERGREIDRIPDRERERGRDLDRIPDRERERARELDRIPERERERARDLDRPPERDRDRRRDLPSERELERDRRRDFERPPSERGRDRGRDFDRPPGPDFEMDRMRDHSRDRGRDYDRLPLGRDSERDRGRNFDWPPPDFERDRRRDRDRRSWEGRDVGDMPPPNRRDERSPRHDGPPPLSEHGFYGRQGPPDSRGPPVGLDGERGGRDVGRTGGRDNGRSSQAGGRGHDSGRSGGREGGRGDGRDGGRGDGRDGGRGDGRDGGRGDGRDGGRGDGRDGGRGDGRDGGRGDGRDGGRADARDGGRGDTRDGGRGGGRGRSDGGRENGRDAGRGGGRDSGRR